MKYSHYHFDHTGDMSTFPPSTSLTVGPGFTAAQIPGYPRNPDAPVLEADYRGRTLHEVSFDSDDEGKNGTSEANKVLKIGRFRAVDFFHDGSFYLLDAPGHAVGHMMGLARTTPSSAAAPTSSPASTAFHGAEAKEGGTDSTFILLAGDAAHHAGEIRPSPYLPLHLSPSSSSSLTPPSVPPPPLASSSSPSSAPVSSTQQATTTTITSAIKTTPYLHPSPQISHDHTLARETIRGVQELDASDDILVVLAHDEALLKPPATAAAHDHHHHYKTDDAGRVQFFPEGFLRDDTGKDGRTRGEVGPGPANQWKRRGWKRAVLWNTMGHSPVGGGFVD